MTDTIGTGGAVQSDKRAVQDVEDVRHELGPFVVAADTTRMPMVFTNAKSEHDEIVYANQSFLDLTGYNISDTIGLPFACLITKPDQKRAAPPLIASQDSNTVGLRCIRKDGTEFDASVLASPVRNKGGQLQQYFLCFIDLTHHVDNRLQAYLKDVEIYRHAPGFIAFTEGPDHRFKFANTAYETLIGRSDLSGRRVSDVLPEIAAQGIIGYLDKVYQSGERFIGKNLPIRLSRGPNGQSETRHLDFIYEPVHDASGSVIGLFCEGSDVTEGQVASDKLEDIENQLMHATRINAMGTMATTLAHELNQPLAAIANYAAGCRALLEQGAIPEHKLEEAMSGIANASNRAGAIIKILREMTKRSAPTFEPFDLGQALEESAQLVRVGGCDDVSISTQCTPSVMVSGNKIQVQQVIINLLRNACEAAVSGKRSGQVLATAMNRSERPCIVIRDNGPGLPSGMKDDIFEWRETSKDDGMGIGLSISRTIAEGHGGQITIEKTGSSGTTIALTFPGPPTD